MNQELLVGEPAHIFEEKRDVRTLIQKHSELCAHVQELEKRVEDLKYKMNHVYVDIH